MRARAAWAAILGVACIGWGSVALGRETPALEAGSAWPLLVTPDETSFVIELDEVLVSQRAIKPEELLLKPDRFDLGFGQFDPVVILQSEREYFGGYKIKPFRDDLLWRETDSFIVERHFGQIFHRPADGNLKGEPFVTAGISKFDPTKEAVSRRNRLNDDRSGGISIDQLVGMGADDRQFKPDGCFRAEHCSIGGFFGGSHTHECHLIGGSHRPQLAGCDTLGTAALLLSNSFAALPLLVTGLPQPIGRSPEQNGGYKKREREAAYKKPLMAVHEADRTFEQSGGSAGEVWGVFAVLGFLMIPAAGLLAGRVWIIRVWCGCLALIALLTMARLI